MSGYKQQDFCSRLQNYNHNKNSINTTKIVKEVGKPNSNEK